MSHKESYLKWRAKVPWSDEEIAIALEQRIEFALYHWLFRDALLSQRRADKLRKRGK